MAVGLKFNIVLNVFFMTVVQVLVLRELTVRMTVTLEIWMNADPGFGAVEVVWVSAGQAGLSWLRAGFPAVMGVIVGLSWNSR